MTVEILFSEVCNLNADWQNAEYLARSLPEADLVRTALTETPYFVTGTPDIVYIGAMTERTQHRVIETLRPYADRLKALIEGGTVILATGNAGEIFMKHITYVAEKTETDALGFLDLSVRTDWFRRYNGKVLGTFENIPMVGFRSQFSAVCGNLEAYPFIRVERGVGGDLRGKLEGARYKNLFCTALLGPVLPVNPLFTEYLLRLAGADVPAAFREQAMAAYEQRLMEFRDPKTVF